MVGLISLALLSGGHGLVHLAEWKEALLIGPGLILVGVKVVVVRGLVF